jgi:hypothetical protein
MASKWINYCMPKTIVAVGIYIKEKTIDSPCKKPRRTWICRVHLCSGNARGTDRRIRSSSGRRRLGRRCDGSGGDQGEAAWPRAQSREGTALARGRRCSPTRARATAASRGSAWARCSPKRTRAATASRGSAWARCTPTPPCVGRPRERTRGCCSLVRWRGYRHADSPSPMLGTWEMGGRRGGDGFGEEDHGIRWSESNGTFLAA